MKYALRYVVHDDWKRSKIVSIILAMLLVSVTVIVLSIRYIRAVEAFLG